jgi:hypothetical protein
MLRVVSPRGTPGCVHLASPNGGFLRPKRLKPLPSKASRAPVLRDPVAWWTACTDGRDMLFVAGNLCTQGDELHRAVVRAACACAREALPVWEANYPNDRRLHIALDTAEAWARGEAATEDVRNAAGAGAWAAAWAWAAEAVEAAWAARSPWTSPSPPSSPAAS